MSEQWTLIRGRRLMAFIAVSVVVVFAGIGMPSIFSPGPLNARVSQTSLGGVLSHAELSNQCSACHAPPWQSVTMAQRCMSCHTSVATQLENGQWPHSMAVSVTKTTCKNGCHTEHRGPASNLILINRGLAN